MKMKNFLYGSLISAAVLSSCTTVKNFSSINNYSPKDTIEVTQNVEEKEGEFVEMLNNFDGNKKILFENPNYVITLFEQDGKLKMYDTKKTMNPKQVNSSFQNQYGISYQRAADLVNRANVLGREPQSIGEVVDELMENDSRIFKFKLSEYYAEWEKAEIEDELAKVSQLEEKVNATRDSVRNCTGKNCLTFQRDLKVYLEELKGSKKELAEARNNVSKYMESTREYLNNLSPENDDKKYKLGEFRNFLGEGKTEIQSQNNSVEGGIYKIKNNSGNYIYVVVTQVSVDSITQGSHEIPVRAITQAQNILTDYASDFSKKEINSTYGSGVVWGLPERVNDKSGKETYEVRVCFARVGNKKLNQKVLDSIEEFNTGN